MDRNGTYRVRLNPTEDTNFTVNLEQDTEILEMLTVKVNDLGEKYTRRSSDYGVIVGRVLANGGFGVPNAKISVFVPYSGGDSYLYPYGSVNGIDSNGIRYNLLGRGENICHREVGTFPEKSFLLDNDVVLDVFSEYYRYTTKTNGAGDYMIYGVPTGSQVVHCDVDLSDIGVLSQRPTDLMFQGHDISEFDSPSQFKDGTNLDTLVQIVSSDNSVDVMPFWGDSDTYIVGVTRCNINVPYEFKPTCVFIGSIVTDEDEDYVNHRCRPGKESGLNSKLIGKRGTIEMIRKDINGRIEEFSISGNQLIDGNGTWCYQIPMNLDYVMTDDEGNIVPSDNPDIGIPTKASVRFRISLNDGNSTSYHTARYLVPCNPEIDRKSKKPEIVGGRAVLDASGDSDIYEFGSDTRDEDFRDLRWNKVYTVKNYIPRVQKGKQDWSRKFIGIKGTNFHEDKNPFPYNHMAISMTFLYSAMCIIGRTFINAIGFINKIISWLDKGVTGWVFDLGCIGIQTIIPGMFGDEDDEYIYVPHCHYGRHEEAREYTNFDGYERSDIKFVETCFCENLFLAAQSEKNEVVNLDFYDDWVNGTLYMPRWYMKRIRKRRNGVNKDKYCSCAVSRNRVKVLDTNAFRMNSDLSFNYDAGNKDKYYNIRAKSFAKIGRGFVMESVSKYQRQDSNGDSRTSVYYYSPGVYEDEGGQFVRMFANDIVMLGSVSENDWDGIPQVMDGFAGTSCTIPPMAREFSEEEWSDEELKTDEIEENGIMFTYGNEKCEEFFGNRKYYNHNNVELGNGLFVDLGCFLMDTVTVPKSKTNLERICEIGVSNDGDVYGKDDTQYTADGFISSNEIYDNDIRAMFATINHLGVNARYYDKEYGMEKPLYRYSYPNSFDGNSDKWMKYYFGQMPYVENDIRNGGYVKFRCGLQDGGDVIRFYNNDGSPKVHGKEYGLWRRLENRTDSMPLYENSFYFYFGSQEGNTAIDRFKEAYIGKCQERIDESISLVLSGDMDTCCTDKPENAINGYVRNAVKPYAVALYDSNGVLVQNMPGVGENDFVISGIVTNRGYFYVTVTDSLGNSATEGVSFAAPGLSFSVRKRDKVKKPTGGYTNGIIAVGEFYFNGEYQSVSGVNGDFVLFSGTSEKVKLTNSSGYSFSGVCSGEDGEKWVILTGFSTGNIFVTGLHECNGGEECEEYSYGVEIYETEIGGITLNGIPMEFLLGSVTGTSYEPNFYKPNGNTLATEIPTGFWRCDDPSEYEFGNFSGMIPTDFLGFSGQNSVNAYKISAMFSMCDSFFSTRCDDENHFTVRCSGYVNSMTVEHYVDSDGKDILFKYRKTPTCLIDSNSPTIVGGHYYRWDSYLGMDVLNHSGSAGNSGHYLDYFNSYEGGSGTSKTQYWAGTSMLGGYGVMKIGENTLPCAIDDGSAHNFPYGAYEMPDSLEGNDRLATEIGGSGSVKSDFRFCTIDRRMGYSFCFIKPARIDRNADLQTNTNLSIFGRGYLIGDILNGVTMPWSGDHEIFSVNQGNSCLYYCDGQGNLAKNDLGREKLYSASAVFTNHSGESVPFDLLSNGFLYDKDNYMTDAMWVLRDIDDMRCVCCGSGSTDNHAMGRTSFDLSGVTISATSPGFDIGSNFEQVRKLGLYQISGISELSILVRDCSYRNPEFTQGSDGALSVKCSEGEGFEFACGCDEFNSGELAYVEYGVSVASDRAYDNLFEGYASRYPVLANCVNYGANPVSGGFLFTENEISFYGFSENSITENYQTYSAGCMFITCESSNKSNGYGKLIYEEDGNFGLYPESSLTTCYSSFSGISALGDKRFSIGGQPDGTVMNHAIDGLLKGSEYNGNTITMRIKPDFGTVKGFYSTFFISNLEYEGITGNFFSGSKFKYYDDKGKCVRRECVGFECGDYISNTVVSAQRTEEGRFRFDFSQNPCLAKSFKDYMKGYGNIGIVMSGDACDLSDEIKDYYKVVTGVDLPLAFGDNHPIKDRIKKTGVVCIKNVERYRDSFDEYKRTYYAKDMHYQGDGNIFSFAIGNKDNETETSGIYYMFVRNGGIVYSFMLSNN